YGHVSTFDTIVAHTKTLVVFGALSPRTAQNEAGGINRHVLEDYLRQLSASGMRIILVSPSRSDMPDWMDVEWWPVRPSTDAALMLGLAGEIVAAGLQDRDFLERCCSGSDRLLAYLDGSSHGVVKNAEWAASISGLSPNQIRELAPF